MINEGFKLTFGVELEHIFAFHEELLKSYLASINDDSEIVKNIPADARLAFRLGPTSYARTRPIYMGWALTGDTDFTTPRDQSWLDQYGMRWYQYQRETYGYRPYADEILQLAKRVLPPTVVVHTDGTYKREDFSQWHLAVDNSLFGVEKSVLEAQIYDRITDTDTVDNWDSDGVELVSPILYPTHESFQIISEWLAMLKGDRTSQYSAFITEHCALHVHIGVPPEPNTNPDAIPDTFALPTLQHLAYILFMYESEINTLHPAFSRGPISEACLVDVKSNREFFLEDGERMQREQESPLSPLSPMSFDFGGLEITTDRPTPAIQASASGGEASANFPTDRPQTVGPPTQTEAPPLSSAIPPSATSDSNSEPTHELLYSPTSRTWQRVKIDLTYRPSFARARQLIFAPNMTLQRLVNIMCEKNERCKIVNWTYLARKSPGKARTLEFRQHEGCLDAEAVKWWVLFCVGLVRLAGAMAARYGVGASRGQQQQQPGGDDDGYKGEGYRFRWGHDCISVFDLLEMMEIGEEGTEYFRRRAALFAVTSE